MSNWKKIGNTFVTTYTGNRKKVAKFLKADGQIEYSVHQDYTNLFAKDCPYPIKTDSCKVASAIVILLFIVAMFLSSALKDTIALGLNIAFILFSFIVFKSVKDIRYPNEQYSLVYIIVISLITVLLLYLAYNQKDTVISNLFYLKQALSKETISIETYNKLVDVSNKFIIIACLISAGMLFFGTVTGARRFGSVMTPLIIIGGFVLFIFGANIALSNKFLEKINLYSSDEKIYMLYLAFLVAIIAMIIFDKAFISRAKNIGGEKSKERKQVSDESK